MKNASLLRPFPDFPPCCSSMRRPKRLPANAGRFVYFNANIMKKGKWGYRTGLYERLHQFLHIKNLHGSIFTLNVHIGNR